MCSASVRASDLFALAGHATQSAAADRERDHHQPPFSAFVAAVAKVSDDLAQHDRRRFLGNECRQAFHARSHSSGRPGISELSGRPGLTFTPWPKVFARVTCRRPRSDAPSFARGARAPASRASAHGPWRTRTGTPGQGQTGDPPLCGPARTLEARSHLRKQKKVHKLCVLS